MLQFITVIQAILYAGKQLQQLHIEEENNGKNMKAKTVCSELLRKLILAASSSSVIGNAAKLLSTLNKEAADHRDLQNLIVISNGEFPEVCTMDKGLHPLNSNIFLSSLSLSLSLSLCFIMPSLIMLPMRS
jgi:DNA mismatch repair protein MSH3